MFQTSWRTCVERRGEAGRGTDAALILTSNVRNVRLIERFKPGVCFLLIVKNIFQLVYLKFLVYKRIQT